MFKPIKNVFFASAEENTNTHIDRTRQTGTQMLSSTA